MLKMDRTVKLLLGAIAALLAVIAFRPMVNLIPSAMAQTTGTSTDTGSASTGNGSSATNQMLPEYLPDSLISLGFQVPQPSIIAVPKGQYVRELQVMDSAHAFLVRYDDRIEVYRIQMLTLDKKTYEDRLAAQQRR